MHEMLTELTYNTFILYNFSNISVIFKRVFTNLLALSLMLLLCGQKECYFVLQNIQSLPEAYGFQLCLLLQHHSVNH